MKQECRRMLYIKEDTDKKKKKKKNKKKTIVECSNVRTCFADLHSQFGQLPLEDRLLLFRKLLFLLVWFIILVERLHLHSASILRFSYREHGKSAKHSTVKTDTSSSVRLISFI